MAIRTIDAPGIEMHEIDRSQYTPAMTGTKVLVTGFANSGEDYIPMIFTSKSAWLNYYGDPKNEAERYFFAASMEVLNQNGVVNCCKLPYENESRDKFVGFKYKLYASNDTGTPTINTIPQALENENLSALKNALPNSEVFKRDVLNYFLANCNVTDSVDKTTVTDEILKADTSLAVLDQKVNQVDRSDDRTAEECDGDFYKVYADGQFADSVELSGKFLSAAATKAQLKSYAKDLSDQSIGVMPKLNAYYFITNTELTATSCVQQDISVVIACSENADYAILTAQNTVPADSAELSDFLVEDIEGLVASDLCGDTDLTSQSGLGDDFFAVFKADKEILSETYFENNGLNVRHVNGIDALQLQLAVDGSTMAADDKDATIQGIYDVISKRTYTLVKGDELSAATEYFDEVRTNADAVKKAQLASIDDILAWSEIRSADPTVKRFWEIRSRGTPSLYDMSTVDEYRTDESRVATNEILIVDKTRKAYGRVPEDKSHKNDERELIGIVPVVTTAANALFAQSLITVDKADTLLYETIKDVHTLDCSQNPYKYLGGEYYTHNVMKSGELSTVAVVSQRFNNEHTSEDNDDDYFDSLAMAANNYFSPISLQADGSFDRENMKKIGLVVFKAFLDASEGNKISFIPVESFVGSLNRDEKNPNTGATTFIDTLVNEQSEYVNIFTNCMPTDAYKKAYNEIVDLFVMPNATADAAALGFYEGMCEKDIDISESILKALDLCYEKVTDINERDIDIVVDGGISNIAQFIKTVYGRKGFYDPASPDAAVWKCKKDDDVKMWKTVVMKLDNFCKNIRKDCMFIADGPRPYCLQGQKKIIRPSKPKNTIDADILPFTKYLTGVNTSYGAGYCDWFQIADEFSGDYFWCPPSIKACGVYIYTDLNFEYWDAPAGLNRGLVSALDVAFSPTNKQAGQIYTKSWNYAVNYPIEGIVLEGQRTLQTKPSALDRVNVRRLMLRLERATYKVLRYVVYEGNTAYTRQRTVDLLEPIFKQAKVGGGLYDYKIVCDETVNTPETIDRNEFHIKIGIKPTKTIEFIMVDFVILSTGASWSEML